MHVTCLITLHRNLVVCCFMNTVPVLLLCCDFAVKSP
jgi:hypothetical protein